MIFLLFCSHPCTDQTFINRKCKIGLCNKELYSEFEENEHIRKNHKIGETFPKGTKNIYKNKMMTGIQSIHKTVDSLSLVKLIPGIQSNVGPMKNKWTQSFMQSSNVNENQTRFDRLRNIKSPSYNSFMHQVQQFPCSMCSNKFKDMESLLKHKIDHKKSIVNCPICLKTFVSNRFLTVHIKDVHVSNRSSLTCELCKENVKNASILLYHLMSHVVSTNDIDPDPPLESDMNGHNETSSDKLEQKQLTRKGKKPNLTSQSPDHNPSGSNFKEVCNNTCRSRVAKKQNNYNENAQKSKELNLLSRTSVFDSNCSNVKDQHSKTLKTSLTKISNVMLEQTNRRKQKQNVPRKRVGFDSDCNLKEIHNENLKPRFTKTQNPCQEKKKTTGNNPKLTSLKKKINKKEVNVDIKIKNQSYIPTERKTKRSSFYRTKYEMLKALEVKCPVCAQCFSEEAHLQSHIVHKHLTRVEYISKCSICHKVETDPKQLSLHMMKHVSENNAKSSVEPQVNPLLLQNESICSESHRKGESSRQKSCSTTIPSSTKTSTPAESNLSVFDTLQVELKEELGQISLETIEDIDDRVSEVESVFKFQCSTCLTGVMSHEELCYHAVFHV